MFNTCCKWAKHRSFSQWEAAGVFVFWFLLRSDNLWDDSLVAEQGWVLVEQYLWSYIDSRFPFFYTGIYKYVLFFPNVPSETYFCYYFYCFYLHLEIISFFKNHEISFVLIMSDRCFEYVILFVPHNNRCSVQKGLIFIFLIDAA